MNARRLPVYLLLDTSGSMQGEPIASVNVGLRTMMAALRQSPYALESVHISIVTFDITIKEVLPLTPLESVNLPEIQCPTSGATMMGAGLEEIVAKVQHEVKKSTPEAKGDWRPLLFVMTDGKPSDTMAFEEVIPKIKACHFSTIVACAAGPKSDPSALHKLADQVVHMDTMDGSTFSSFFQWVTATVNSGSTSMGASTNLTLPPPPPEVQIVI
ncbi:MAG: VWA domain-containing protein [Halothiobacillus sp.]|jgi:uncharacterized protein YegL|nr:VWA domain-containing protein [Halothiobacillus sp.]